MKIDKFLNKYPDFICEDKKLKDAIVFKINMQPLTEDEIDTALKPYYEYVEKVQGQLKTATKKTVKDAKQIHRMEYGESGLTDYPAARLPYDNVVFLMNVEENLGESCYWFLHHGEKDDMIHNTVVILDDNMSVLHPNQEFTAQIKKVSEKLNPEPSDYLLKSYRMDFYQNKESLSTDWGDTYIKRLSGGYTSYNPEIRPTYQLSIHAAMKTCAIMKCSNIETEKNVIPAKMQKARLKKGKLPLVSYYTLKIKTNKKKAQGQKGINTRASNVRIHLCRGHFKEYTKDKPLFGKYTGLFWWQPSTRGNISNGSIVKDYEIEI